MSATVTIGRRAGQNEEILRFLFGAAASVQLGEGVVRHAAPPSGPRVRYDSNVLLYVTVFFVTVEGKV